MAPEAKKKRKRFMKIGEVCELVGLESHVIRSWEDIFTALRPKKNRAGHRIFEQSDVDLICKIKNLVHEQGFTLRGAQLQMTQNKSGNVVSMQSKRPSERLVSEAIRELQEVRSILHEARNLLDSN